MENATFNYPSSSEIRAIEAKAHELRAKAFREAASAIAMYAKSAVLSLRFYLTRRELV